MGLGLRAATLLAEPTGQTELRPRFLPGGGGQVLVAPHLRGGHGLGLAPHPGPDGGKGLGRFQPGDFQVSIRRKHDVVGSDDLSPLVNPDGGGNIHHPVEVGHHVVDVYQAGVLRRGGFNPGPGRFRILIKGHGDQRKPVDPKFLV